MIKKIFFLILIISFSAGGQIQNQCGIAPLNFFKIPYFNINNVNGKQRIDFNFKCPSIQSLLKNNQINLKVKNTIKTLIKNKTDYRTILEGANLVTGRYTCKYIFTKNYSFQITLYNNVCSKNYNNFQKYFSQFLYSTKEIPFKIPDIKNLMLISFNKPLSLYNLYKNYYNDAINAIYEIYQNIHGLRFVDFNSIDSHTHYADTIPAVLIGLITLDNSYFRNNYAVKQTGEININIPNFQILSSLHLKNVKNLSDIQKKVENVANTLNKEFWGFYYYLITNLNIGFSNLIKILFGIGVIGIFGGSAILKKINIIGTEETQRFQFDFSKYFLVSFGLLIFFLAPVVPQPKIPSEYIYRANKNQNTQINSQITIAQELMRYSWQLGNYFANYISDFGTYAYLKYIENSYGITARPEMLISLLNIDYYNIANQYYYIANKELFLKELCYLSYPRIYNQFLGFPKRINPYTYETYNPNNPQDTTYILNKYLGIDRVNYQICSNYYESLNNNLSNFINTLNDFKNYNKAIFIFKNISRAQVIKFNKTIADFINLHNQIGWLSSISLPLINKIFKDKDIFNNINYISKYQNELLKTHNIYYVKVTNHYEQYSSNYNRSVFSYELEQLNKLFIDKEAKFSILFSKYFSNKIQNLLSFITSVASHMSSYLLIPGFGSLFNGINKFISIFIPNKTTISQLANFSLSLILTYFIIMLFINFLVMLIVSIAGIIKVIFYYLETIIMFLLSYVMVLWGITFTPQKTIQSLGQFIFNIFKLAFTPILIVLSMFLVMIINKLIDMLYELLVFIGTHISSIFLSGISEKNYTEPATSYSLISLIHSHIANTLNSIIVLFNYIGDVMATGSLQGTAHIIILFIKLIIDIIIIWKFNEWAFEIVGRKIEGGISAEITKIGEKTINKMGGGLV